MFYDRVYRVKKWIIGQDLNEKQQELLKKSMPKTNTVFCPWPSLEMSAELKKLAGEGYFEYVNQPMPYFLEMTLALRAVVNITRRAKINAQISPSPLYHRLCNNRIAQESDYTRLCDEILKANDEITLSQVFDIRDHQHEIWVSFNADKETVSKLAEQVVVLGNSDKADIDLSDLNNKDLSSAISAAFRN